jgi:molybdopterin adenylyltransferase
VKKPEARSRKPEGSAGEVPSTVSRLPSAVFRLAILTISDLGARGERADTSGDAIAEWASAHHATIAARAIVPDDVPHIVSRLLEWCDADIADLVLTTGGTGLSERDVTPEATRVVIERDAPGISELIRMSSATRFPRAALSRGVSGTRNRTLIVNLPGSPGGVKDGLAVLDGFIAHAIGILRGERTEHSEGRGKREEGSTNTAGSRKPEDGSAGSRSPSPEPRVPTPASRK